MGTSGATEVPFRVRPSDRPDKPGEAEDMKTALRDFWRCSNCGHEVEIHPAEKSVRINVCSQCEFGRDGNQKEATSPLRDDTANCRK